MAESAQGQPPATDDKRERAPADGKPAPLEITESGGRLVITGVGWTPA